MNRASNAVESYGVRGRSLTIRAESIEEGFAPWNGTGVAPGGSGTPLRTLESRDGGAPMPGVCGVRAPGAMLSGAPKRVPVAVVVSCSVRRAASESPRIALKSARRGGTIIVGV